MLGWGSKAAVIGMAAAMVFAAPPAGARQLPSQLRCRSAGGFGFFVAGRRAITCTYYRPDDRVEFYTGSSDKLGIDLGPTNAQKLNFVVTGAAGEEPGELDGKFVGAQAGATIGFGVSSEALVGGATGHVALLPFPPQSFIDPDTTGINVSGGLGILELHYAGSERRSLRDRY